MSIALAASVTVTMDVGQNWNYRKLWELVESVVVVVVMISVVMAVVMVVGDLDGEFFFRAAVLCPSHPLWSILSYPHTHVWSGSTW